MLTIILFANNTSLQEKKIVNANESGEIKPLADGGDISMMADLQGSLFSLSFRQIKELKVLL